MKSKKILILAIIFALITTFLIYMFLNRSTPVETTAEKEFVTVPAAAKNLPAKYKIVQADIKMVEIEKSSVHPSAILDSTQIIGQMTKDAVVAGEPFLKERLIDPKRAALAYNIPEGKRAVSIVLSDASMVSTMIRPGDFVDIIATFESETVQEAYDVYNFYPRGTKTILQNVQILAMGQRQQITQETITEAINSVTFAVDVADKEKLIFAYQNGSLYLALRPVEDDKVYPNPNVMKKDIIVK